MEEAVKEVKREFIPEQFKEVYKDLLLKWDHQAAKRRQYDDQGRLIIASGEDAHVFA